MFRYLVMYFAGKVTPFLFYLYTVHFQTSALHFGISCTEITTVYVNRWGEGKLLQEISAFMELTRQKLIQ